MLDVSEVYVARTSLTGLGNLNVVKRGFVWAARLGSAVHLLVSLVSNQFRVCEQRGC